jgi:hypothetical protein
MGIVQRIGERVNGVREYAEKLLDTGQRVATALEQIAAAADNGSGNCSGLGVLAARVAETEPKSQDYVKKLARDLRQYWESAEGGRILVDGQVHVGTGNREKYIPLQEHVVLREAISHINLPGGDPYQNARTHVRIAEGIEATFFGKQVRGRGVGRVFITARGVLYLDLIKGIRGHHRGVAALASDTFHTNEGDLRGAAQELDVDLSRDKKVYTVRESRIITRGVYQEFLRTQE